MPAEAKMVATSITRSRFVAMRREAITNTPPHAAAESRAASERYMETETSPATNPSNPPASPATSGPIRRGGSSDNGNAATQIAKMSQVMLQNKSVPR